jgi:hypothetical protein
VDSACAGRFEIKLLAASVDATAAACVAAEVIVLHFAARREELRVCRMFVTCEGAEQTA